MIETPLEFQSDGTTCRGILYTPDADSKGLPCVVMAHGFGLTHASGLAPFKEAFCNAGYAVFAFDYRHFGDSDGEPRQLFDIEAQLADCQGAIAFARNHLSDIYLLRSVLDLHRSCILQLQVPNSETSHKDRLNN